MNLRWDRSMGLFELILTWSCCNREEKKGDLNCYWWLISKFKSCLLWGRLKKAEGVWCWTEQDGLWLYCRKKNQERKSWSWICWMKLKWWILLKVGIRWMIRKQFDSHIPLLSSVIQHCPSSLLLCSVEYVFSSFFLLYLHFASGVN